MNNDIEYGVILAAGSATRLYPLSKYFPKITLPIFDNPLVIHHFNIMKSAGVKKVFIVVSDYSIDVISAVLKKAEELNVEYEFINQSVPNGTGHALWLLKDYLVDKRFLLLLGDEYYNDIGSFSRLSNFGSEDNILGIVEYNNIENIISGCNVIFNDDRVIQLIEKPAKEQISGKWCWDGSVVLKDEIFSILDEMYFEFKKALRKQVCIVQAMQQLLEKDIQIKFLKKHCANINITYDIDLVKACFIECSKKYDKETVLKVLKELN